MRFHDFPDDERSAWRAEPVTDAALVLVKALRDEAASELASAVVSTVGEAEALIRIAAGKVSMAERILKGLTA